MLFCIVPNLKLPIHWGGSDCLTELSLDFDIALFIKITPAGFRSIREMVREADSGLL